jgi:predicted nuclease of predicted toxin-antitoxin system
MPWKNLEMPDDQERRELNDRFRGKARFLVDENAGIEIAEMLRSAGYNSKSVIELGLKGRGDEEVFAMAWQEKRVIITHDGDFLDDRNYPPHRNPGVVIIGLGADGRDNEGLLQCLVLTTYIAGRNAEWFVGRKIEFTSSDSFTISSQGVRARYRWKRHSDPQVWED